VLGAVALDVAVLRGLTLVLRMKFSRAASGPDIISHHCEATTLISVADVSGAWRALAERNPLRLVGMSPLVESVPDFERYFGVEVVSIYGMTEVGTALTARSPADSRITGWPVRGYQCRLVDVPGVHAVASRAGRVGELVVRPDFVTSEYDLGGELAIGGWEDGWLNTGDLFAEIGGAYSFVGRIKDSIRRRGRNISADDVEGVVRTLPDVADCACVGVSCPDPGGRFATDDEIGIFVIAGPGAVLDPERLRRGWASASRRSCSRATWISLPTCRIRSAARVSRGHCGKSRSARKPTTVSAALRGSASLRLWELARIYPR
jgi:acyl-CoA synthetase (AMP-forming)/AMP-acid ligase II